MASTRLHHFLENREALINQARKIVGDRARAEDVVQDAWERFAGSAGRDGNDNAVDKPVAYLRRIVRNLAIDLSRRQTVENAHPDGDAGLHDLPDDESILNKAKPHFDGKAITAITRKNVTDWLDGYADRPAQKKLVHSVLLT